MVLMRALYRWLYRQSVRLSLLAVLLLFLYVLAGRILAPLPDSYRPEIEAWLGRQLQQDVRIDSIKVRWEGLGPRFYAAGVRLGPEQGGVQMGTLAFRPDMPRSLWHRRLLMESIGVRGLELELQQQADGRWQLQGVPLAAAEAPAVALSWQLLHDSLQQLGRFSMVNTRIRVQPAGQDDYVLDDVSLTLAPGRDMQLLQARAFLPDGQPLALRARLALERSGWQDSTASIYLELPDSDWAPWLPASLLPDSGVQQARLGGQLWLQLAAGADVQLVAEVRQAALRGQRGDWPLALELGAGQLYGRWHHEQLDVWSSQLPVRLMDEEVQPLAWHARYQRTDSDEPVWQLAVRQLQLQPLLAAALDLPLPGRTPEILQQLNGSGQLNNLNLRWYPQRPWQALEYDTNLQALAWLPGFNAPGASGVSGRLQGTLAGGQLQLASKDGFSLYLDRLFAEPWHYHNAHARLDWTLEGQAFHLSSPGLQVVGDEGVLTGNFELDLPGKDSDREPTMDLHIGLRQGDAAFTRRYLPKAMQARQPGLHDWLGTAIQAGRIEQGYYGYHGSLAADAAAGARSNRLYFEVDQAQLAYQPDWPPLQDARVRVHVHDHRVQVDLQRGRILETRIAPARAEIGYAADGSNPRLVLKAGLDSRVQDGLQLVQNTPLAASLPQLAGWQGEGRLPATLQLQVPLTGKGVPQVQLQLQMQDAWLSMPGQRLRLEGLNGSLHIDSQKGLQSPVFTGRFLGQPFTARAAPASGQTGWSTVIRAGGQMPVIAVRDWLRYQGPLPLTGRLGYELELTLAERNSQLAVVSDLAGVSIDLPRPLGKTAAQKVPTQWHMTLDDQEAQYWLTHGGKFSALLAGGEKTPWRGQLVLDERQPRLPATAGIEVSGKLGLLDGPAWLAALQQLGSTGETDGGLLSSIQLDIGRLDGFALPLDSLKLNARPLSGNRGWTLQLAATQLQGTIDMPTRQPLQVRLERLQLPATPATKDQDSNFDPAGIPAMQVQIDQLLLQDQPLGRWSFRVVPQPGSALVQELDLGLKGMRLQGELDWSSRGNSRFTGSLSGEQLEEVLEAWDYAPNVSAERFSLMLDVIWPGGLGELSAQKLSGTADFRLRHGQLLVMDGSKQALRVFGILNFDSIGRRLRLDFRDLLGKGLAYDRINGSLDINNGIYQTREPMTLEGISSNLALEGSADAGREQLDAWLQVTMPVSRNLPLVAIAAGAPAVGGALFVFDRLAGDRFSRMAAVRYRLEGNWLEPTVTLSRELPPGAIRAEDAGE